MNYQEANGLELAYKYAAIQISFAVMQKWQP